MFARNDRREQSLNGLARGVASLGAVAMVRPAFLHQLGENDAIGEALRFERHEPLFDRSLHPATLTPPLAESIL